MTTQKQRDKAEEFLEGLDQKKYPRMLIRDSSFHQHFSLSGLSESYSKPTVSAHEEKHVERYLLDTLIDHLREIKEKASKKGFVQICLFENRCYEDDGPSYTFYSLRQEEDTEYHKRVEALIETEKIQRGYQLEQYKALHKIFGGKE